MAVVLGVSAGFVTTAPTADPDGTPFFNMDSRCVAVKHTMPADKTIVDLVGVYVSSFHDAVSAKVNIYTDSSGPDAQVFTSESFAITGSGWNNYAPTSFTGLTPGVAYWIVMFFANAVGGDNATDVTASGGAGYALREVQSDLSNPFGTPDSSDADGVVPIFARVAASGLSAGIRKKLQARRRAA